MVSSEAIIVVFAIIALGYFAASTGLLKMSIGDALADFVFVIAIPLLLFRTMVSADFGETSPWTLWLSYFTGVLAAWVCGQVLVRKVFGRDRRAAVVGGVTAAFSNLVVVGIPFVLSVFGQEGFAVLSLLVAVHLIAMMVVSLALFEWTDASREDAEMPFSAGRLTLNLALGLIRNPLLIGVIAGSLIRAAGIPVHETVLSIIGQLAGVAGPVALFALGMGLKKYDIKGNIRSALALAGVKLFLMPAVVLAMVWMLALPPLAAKVAVIAAALPTGANPFLIASRFGTGQAIASNTMTLSTAASSLTTLGWIFLVTAIFGP